MLGGSRYRTEQVCSAVGFFSSSFRFCFTPTAGQLGRMERSRRCGWLSTRRSTPQVGWLWYSSYRQEKKLLRFPVPCSTGKNQSGLMQAGASPARSAWVQCAVWGWLQKHRSLALGPGLPELGHGGKGPPRTGEEPRGGAGAGVSSLGLPWCLLFSLGGAKACDGSVGPEERHQPPLIFNLDRDIQEQEPLDVASAEYQAVLPAISRAYARALENIATDNVSVADYSRDPAAVPCCSAQHVACRCQAHPAASLHRSTERRAKRLCL